MSPFLSENNNITISRLAAVYEHLAVGSDLISFGELLEELKAEEAGYPCSQEPTSPTNSQNSAADMSLEKDSANSLEASPSTTEPPVKMDAPPQTEPALLTKPVTVSLKRRLYTVAQLVVEPDSQSPSLSLTVPSQEEETQVGAEMLQEAEEPSQNDLQSPVKVLEISKPIRNPRRKSRHVSR